MGTEVIVPVLPSSLTTVTSGWNQAALKERLSSGATHRNGQSKRLESKPSGDAGIVLSFQGCSTSTRRRYCLPSATTTGVCQHMLLVENCGDPSSAFLQYSSPDSA